MAIMITITVHTITIIMGTIQVHIAIIIHIITMIGMIIMIITMTTMIGMIIGILITIMTTITTHIIITGDKKYYKN